MQHLAVHPHSHPAFVTAYQHGGTFAAPPFPPGFIQGHPSGGHVFHASPPCLRQMMAGVPTAGPLYPSVSSQLVPSMASLPPLPAHQPDDSTGSPASSTIASGEFGSVIDSVSPDWLVSYATCLCDLLCLLR